MPNVVSFFADHRVAVGGKNGIASQQQTERCALHFCRLPRKSIDFTSIIVEKACKHSAEWLVCVYNLYTHCVGGFLYSFFLWRKNPPYDVLTFGALGNYSHTGTGPQWQDWLARKLNVTYYISPQNYFSVDFIKSVRHGPVHNPM